MVISDARASRPRQEAPHIRGAIARRRLLDRLHANMGYHFQVVKSPAGYGKTTLLADFARELEVPVCWYTLTDIDRDPVNLYENLSRAIAGFFPDCELPATDITAAGSGALANALNEFLGRIPDYFVLIIEDLHEVARTPGGEMLNRLTDAWPDNGHLLLSARSLESFDRINDHLARQQAASLSSTDLSFTADEVVTLAREYHSAELGDVDVQNLIDKLEGWPLGISLILNSARGISAMNTGGRNQVFDFLTRQVLEQQPMPSQKLLLGLSTFVLIEPDICAEVLGVSNIRKKLRQFVESNLFITEAGGDNYQYHQLFREFLQASLKDEDIDRYYELHLKAAMRYESIGRHEPAVEHFLAARDYQAAADLILRIGEDMFQQGRWTLLVEWIDRLPVKSRTDSIGMNLLYAQCLVHTGEPSQAGQIISGILNDETQNVDKVTRAKALYARSSACRLLGQKEQSKLDAEEAAELLGKDGSYPGLKGDIYSRLGFLHLDDGEFTQSLQMLKTARRYFEKVFNVSSLASVNNGIGVIHKNLGDLSQASAFYEFARQGFAKTGNRGKLAMVLANIAFIQHKHGLYDLVLDSLRIARENVRAAGYQRIETGIVLALGEVYRDLGEFAESLKYLNESLEIARQAEETNFVTYAKAGIGETYRMMGEDEQAFFWTKEAIAQVQAEQKLYELKLFQLQLAMIKDSQGKHEEAVEDLTGVYKNLLTIGDMDALARTCFAAAIANFSLKQYEETSKWLNWMVGYIESLGYDDFAVLQGIRNPLLVQYAATREIGGKYFVRLVERIKQKRQQLSSVKQQIPEQTGLTRLQSYGFNEEKVVLDDLVVTDQAWRSNRAKELFFYVLGHPGRTAEDIASQLWPEMAPSKSISNFHINLFRARRATSPGIIIQENGHYYISSDIEFWYDVREFEACVDGFKQSPPEERDKMVERLISLYRGKFMPGFDSEWVDAKRYELENKYLRLLFEMVRYYATSGKMEKVVSLVERVLDTDPDGDEVYYQGIQAYLALGDSLSASHLYKRYLSNLKELDAEPEPRIESLVGKLSVN